MTSLFLKQQVHVIDSQRSKLLVGTLQVEQQTSKGHKDSPENVNVSFRKNQHISNETHMVSLVAPSSKRYTLP